MIQIDHDRCTGCAACVEACPSQALTVQDASARVVVERCTDCGTCVDVCPQGAIVLVEQAAPAAASQDVLAAGPDGQPAGRQGQTITVHVPPAALAPVASPPARKLGLALGAALAHVGREVGLRLLDLATECLQGRIAAAQRPSSWGTRRPRAGGFRWRRQRRGRR